MIYLTLIDDKLYIHSRQICVSREKTVRDLCVRFRLCKYNFFPETKQISLDFNVIYLCKYLKRAALQIEHISIFANHDDNNVHYSTTKSFLLKFYFYILIRIV